MGRLTYWNEEYGCWSYHCASGDAAKRLAAYENTGLEPEEITKETPACVFYCNRRCNLDGDWCSEGPGCPRELSPGDAMHLLKLAQAEKDGRLAVLPTEDYTFRIRGDIALGIIKANCQTARLEAEAELEGENNET